VASGGGVGDRVGIGESGDRLDADELAVAKTERSGCAGSVRRQAGPPMKTITTSEKIMVLRETVSRRTLSPPYHQHDNMPPSTMGQSFGVKKMCKFYLFLILSEFVHKALTNVHKSL